MMPVLCAQRVGIVEEMEAKRAAVGQGRLRGRRIALTGAGGFIGRHVLSALVADGARVTAILRGGHDRAAIERTGAAVVIAPLTDPARTAGALAGHDTVCHFAYDVRAPGEANVAALALLTRAAAAAGVARLVHASSVVVYDDWPNGALTEAAPAGSAGGGAYRQAKIAMERMLADGPMPAIILQPTIVYGPGSALWTDKPMAALGRGTVVLPDPPGLCPAVHAADVAEATVLAVALADPGRCERFLISGPDMITWADLFRGYARMLGTGEVRLEPHSALLDRLGPAPAATAGSSGPSAAARISAALRTAVGSRRFDRIMARLGSARGPAVTWPDRSALSLYSARPVILPEAARNRLGFVARLSFAQGLETIRAQSR